MAWALDGLRSQPELATWATAQRRRNRQLATALAVAACIAAVAAAGWGATALTCRPASAEAPAVRWQDSASSTVRGTAGSCADSAARCSTRTAAAHAAELSEVRGGLASATAERDKALADLAAAKVTAAKHGRQRDLWQQERTALLRQLEAAKAAAKLAMPTAAGAAAQRQMDAASPHAEAGGAALTAERQRRWQWLGFEAMAWAAMLQAAALTAVALWLLRGAVLRRDAASKLRAITQPAAEPMPPSAAGSMAVAAAVDSSGVAASPQPPVGDAMVSIGHEHPPKQNLLGFFSEPLLCRSTERSISTSA